MAAAGLPPSVTAPTALVRFVRNPIDCCWGCGATAKAGAPSRSLQHCAGCRVAVYCSPGCSATDRWAGGDGVRARGAALRPVRDGDARRRAGQSEGGRWWSA